MSRRKFIAEAALAQILRQLADGTRAGLSASDTLTIVSGDSDLGRPAARMLADILDRLRADQPLSAALGEEKSVFPREAVELVKAGEDGSMLPQALELMARDYEYRAVHRSGIAAALTWPLVVVGFLVFVMFVLMVFVVPAFRSVFSNFGADLPAPTLLIMAASDFFVAWWYLILPIVIAAAWYLRAYRRRYSGGFEVLDAILIRVPFVRAYLTKTFVSRLTQIMASAAEHRLPVAPAIAYLRATAGNRNLGRIAESLEGKLAEGKDLVSAVIATPQMPARLAAALELGSRANNLGITLKQVVTVSENDAARSLMRFQQALLVTVYVVLGMLVGGVVIGMYLPIFKLGGAV